VLWNQSLFGPASAPGSKMSAPVSAPGLNREKFSKEGAILKSLPLFFTLNVTNDCLYFHNKMSL